MSEKRVLGWLDSINEARAIVRKDNPEVDRIPNAVVMAFLQKETGGRVNAAIGSNEFGFGIPVIKKSGVYRSIMGGFQMRVDRFVGAMSRTNKLQYLNKPIKDKGKISLGKDNCIAYSKEIFDNKTIQVEAFLRDMLDTKDSHNYRADFMGLCWFNPRSLKKYINQLPREEKDRINRGEMITQGSDQASIDFLNREQIEGNNNTLSYPTGIYRNTKRFSELLNEPINEQILFVKDWSNNKRGDSVIGGEGASTIAGSFGEKFSAIIGNEPFNLASYVTPEELRSNIVAEFVDISDWYLLQMGDKEQQLTDDQKKNNAESVINRLVDELTTQGSDIANKIKLRFESSSNRGDTSLNPRQTYIQAIVEAEYLKRRHGVRSITAVAGPFNPYPVAGLPGLIMTQTRPIIAHVESISHSINVAAGNGSTSTSFGYPRYHDEGEVYYFMGGEYTLDPLLRRFPQWHNSLTVPVNHVQTLDQLYEYGRGTEQLDVYYQFLIGCDSIDYVSCHSGVSWTKNDYELAIKERIPGPFKINPETLEIKEYNSAIAEIDENGRFKPGTLAHKIYGQVEPDRSNKMIMSVDEQNEYCERYGVREEDLLIRLLENEYSNYKGRLILYGPTFSGSVNGDGKKGPNYFQSKIVDWMEDLDRRDLKGGVK